MPDNICRMKATSDRDTIEARGHPDTMSTTTKRMLMTLALLAATGCASTRPDAVQPHDDAMAGAPLIALYDGTYAESNKSSRVETGALEAGNYIVNLNYPTSGRENWGKKWQQQFDATIEQHADFLAGYVGHDGDAGPAPSIVLVGFSQGGCLTLDVSSRLASRNQDAVLDRMSLLLIAPAREVVVGFAGLPVAKHMARHCTKALTEIHDQTSSDPHGALARLLEQRTWIAWGDRDGVVDIDTLPEIAGSLSNPFGRPRKQARVHARLMRVAEFSCEDTSSCAVPDSHIIYSDMHHIDWTHAGNKRPPPGGSSGPCELHSPAATLIESILSGTIDAAPAHKNMCSRRKPQRKAK